MAVSISMNQAGLEQLITKADAELATLQAESEHAEKLLTSAQSELEVISTRQSARTQQIHIAGQSVATVKEELEAARLKAKLSEGTLAEGEDSIKRLEKRLLRLEKQEHELQTKCTREAAADATRETAVRAAIHQAQEAITSLQKEQQTTHAARESAFQDLGNAKKQDVMFRLKELHEIISKTRQEALDAVHALDAYADEALSSLSEWPSLQAQLQPFLPAHQDASTDLLEAQISLLSVLLNNGKTADIDSFLVSQTLGRFGSLNQLLELTDRDLRNAFIAGDMQNLRERRALAEKLLAAYRVGKQHTLPVEQHVQAKRQRW